MSRPKKKRLVAFEPGVTYFKPRGVPLPQLEGVVLTFEELETLRLRDLENLDQTAAAEKMGVSQSTFHRVLSEAHQKVADALVSGKSIKIEGGDYIMAQAIGRGAGLGRGAGRGGGGRGRMGGPFAAGPGGTCVCPSCQHEIPHQAGVPCYQQKCPKCGSVMIRKG